MSEKWKPVKDWEDLYEVSDKGRVKNSLTNHIVIGDTNNCGYERVCFYKKGHKPEKQRIFRHRLVAETFIDNPENLPQVNHKDYNTHNNCVDNLEWVTNFQNQRHSLLYGKREYKPIEVGFLNGLMCKYDTIQDLSREIGVSDTLIKFWIKNESSTYIDYGIVFIHYI